MWTAGAAYERYMGRWSRLLAGRVVAELAAPRGLRWLDVGCGTGALTVAIRDGADPADVVGIDPSPELVAHARSAHPDLRFLAAEAAAVPLPDAAVDVAASGLVLNFVAAPGAALAEFVRVTAPGGTVAAYVWDYADGMEMLRLFWSTAVALDASAADLDEGARFPLCRPEPLRALWVDAGLADVTVAPVEVRTRFSDVADYWDPFLGAVGPAPAYVASLDDDRRAALRAALVERLPAAADGSVALRARAWLVRGSRQ